jgi:creatinine amidohydrolase
MRETTFGGHACESESSTLIANYPELAKPERVPDEPALPRKRLEHLPPTFTGIGWYADYPAHYAGDARPASAEKGRARVEWEADTLARYIAAVKADQVIPALEREFFARADEVSEP